MTADPDRLYSLLPTVYRVNDAARGYPLRDLLRVVAEQVQAVEDDIDRMYDNWFIETAADWAVPYIAELVGYTPVADAGDPATARADENRILVPRREVADTIAYRRRRGTLSVQEDLAAAIAGWPSRAVEYFRLLAWTQHLNHQRQAGSRARLVDLRNAEALDRIGTAFDPFAHSVDIRRIASNRSRGLFNIPSVGHWVWRLGSYPLTRAPAFCVDASTNSYAFSVLGNDAPLFARPSARRPGGPTAAETDLPVAIRRRALFADPAAYYGEGKALAIHADWAGGKQDAPVPVEKIIAADLSDWRYAPPRGHIAVDPHLGRFRFPVDQLPRRVNVSYHYGFSAAIGGGEYPRQLHQHLDAVTYTVGETADFPRIGAALAAWRDAGPRHAIVEFTDSRAYVEPIDIALAEGQSLQLRAASGARPTLRLLDWQTDAPDAMTVTMAEASSLVLDGLLVTGRGLRIAGAAERPVMAPCGAHVAIRHCTFVPGWSLETTCRPTNPSKESLELRNVRARVSISHSILGPIDVIEDEVHAEPIPLGIEDSIIDAMGEGLNAIGGPQGRPAHVLLTIRRSTIFGIVEAHAIALGENSIFVDCLHVARRQIGCLRFCAVPRQCRTPRRHACQPDLAIACAIEDGPEAGEAAAARVRPLFTARRYGRPGYAQLSADIAPEIATGADDGAEMGAFHDLFQPQRLANLQGRLDEFTPGGMVAGVLIAN